MAKKHRGKVIVIIGDPTDGFDYIGPFKVHEDALSYVERQAKGENWWIIRLIKPEKV